MDLGTPGYVDLGDEFSYGYACKHDQRVLLVQASPLIHRAVAEAIERSVAPGSRILDVASGTGALAQRLADANYVVTATSWDARCAATVPCVGLDLNTNWGPDQVDGLYDCVCTIEIIEHVENPTQLLRSIASVVRPGGRIFVSTPNLAGIDARVNLFVKGYFPDFSGDEMRKNGHISPLPSEVLLHLGWCAGLDAVSLTLAPTMRRKTLAPGQVIKRAIFWALQAILKGDLQGRSACYEFTRSTRPPRHPSEPQEVY